MLNMRQKAIVVIISALAAVLTAGLIRATFTYDVELVSSPGGPVIAAPARKPFNISCQLVGGDASNISFMKWLGPKNNDDMAHSNGTIVARVDNLLGLVFKDPTPEDSGMYKCRAKYAKDYDLLYAVNIVFYGPTPVFDVSFENATFEEGESGELYCLARGETPMTYTWYNQSDDVVSVSTSSNGSWLFFPEVRPFHRGMYTCNANNSHGLVSKLFHLDVTPKKVSNNTDEDTPVEEDIQVVNVSATSVLLQIPTSKVARYIDVKYREYQENREYKRRFSPALDSIYSIENLIPSGLYSFQYLVTALEQNGSWSEVLRVTLLPDVPQIIVRRQDKGILELDWFRKLDDIMRRTVDHHEIKYYSVSMLQGNEWKPDDCATTIQLPSCKGASYIIAGLRQGTYYVIELRAHTESGYGEAAQLKIYVSA